MGNDRQTGEQVVDPIVFGLYGAGGFAREVMPLALHSLNTTVPSHPGAKRHVYFMETRPTQATVNGLPLLAAQAFFDLPSSLRLFNIAVGESRTRQRLADECLARGARPLTLQSPHAVVYENNEIGEGAVLCAFAMVTSNARIGRFFHLNIYAYVAHDCVIGDFVTFAPGVHCNGNVHVHDHAYIGTGAVLKQGTSSTPLVIGEGAVVGMGAVVTRDVAPGTTVVGNPARPLARG
jgi:sugar O-acyltransferase (sialic acid O-acetyltransferase NeuD family)